MHAAVHGSLVVSPRMRQKLRSRSQTYSGRLIIVVYASATKRRPARYAYMHKLSTCVFCFPAHRRLTHQQKPSLLIRAFQQRWSISPKWAPLSPSGLALRQGLLWPPPLLLCLSQIQPLHKMRPKANRILQTNPQRLPRYANAERGVHQENSCACALVHDQSYAMTPHAR